jgi:hypothetical protein
MMQQEISQRALALQKRKLTKTEAAQYLNEVHGLPVAPRTLDNKAWSGDGPVFYKAAIGRRLYDPADLDAWAAHTLGAPRRSTSDAA